MAPFCLNSRGDLSLPGQSRRVQPRRTFHVELIRLLAISSLCRVLTPIRSAPQLSAKNMETFPHLSLPMPQHRAANRENFQLVLTRNHKLVFPSLSFKSIFLSLISMTTDRAWQKSFSQVGRLMPMANQSAPEEDCSCADLIMFALLFLVCVAFWSQTCQSGHCEKDPSLLLLKCR